MPEMTQSETIVRSLKVGDRVQHACIWRIVSGIEHKVKWSFIHFGTDRVRVETDSIITVERMQQTEEEKRELYRAAAEASFSRQMGEAKGRWIEAKIGLMNRLETEYVVEAWEIGQFASLQISARIWMIIAKNYETVTTRDEDPMEPGLDTIIVVINRHVESITNSILNETQQSRTDFHGAFESATRDANRTFLRDVKYDLAFAQTK